MLVHVRQRTKDKGVDQSFLIKASTWNEVFAALAEMIRTNRIKITGEDNIIIGLSTQFLIEVKS